MQGRQLLQECCCGTCPAYVAFTLSDLLDYKKWGVEYYYVHVQGGSVQCQNWGMFWLPMVGYFSYWCVQNVNGVVFKCAINDCLLLLLLLSVCVLTLLDLMRNSNVTKHAHCGPLTSVETNCNHEQGFLQNPRGNGGRYGATL